MRSFMRFFYYLLYHPFAFTYDLVAWVVSFGKWNDWVLSIFPHLEGTRILELGHGPGHLQRFFRDRGLSPVAIDESTQMGNLAKRRLGANHKLARGLAQSLPFVADSFDTVVSTFPSEYIFDPRTLAEVKRVLTSGGKLIVLPAAFPSNEFLKWLYKVTGETPETLDDILKERLKRPFVQVGFAVEVQIVELISSRLVVLIARN
ncbi:MAG: methyltransferase domain-containing protein [Chloroflexi bacterium]|nr:methyltransferase domain-containing protein [Chloroflexota bacterium]